VRDIEIEDKLKIRFPARGEQFVLGVEIGMLATLMACGHRSIMRQISAANVDLARKLAQKLGYRIEMEGGDGERVFVRLEDKRTPPKLRLVQGGAPRP
jgi:hypothetical protein